MCGIVGAVSAAPIDASLVAAMRDRLAHRGPDHAGLWLAGDARVCLGHRRLAIIDLRPEANQPMQSWDGRYIITLNGEIYNFRQIRQELERGGARFRTRSDTEVLLEAYRCWGADCLARLSGMFAFAIWDSRERRLFCARDRVGEKPFHYALVNGTFIFASELKALLLWPGLRRDISYPALIDFLSFGYIPDPKCIWESCRKLSPGHSLTIELPGMDAPIVRSPEAYWDLTFNPDPAVSDWGPRLRDTLQAAAEEMALADVPVGAFLSGGVDSSSVTAALSHAGCSVEAFTVGFREAQYDERDWARQVVNRYRVPHTERVVDVDDVEPVLDKLLWHYDEPFNDYSYLPTYYLCREARRSVTVALSGDGADELFAGYGKYRRLALRGAMQRLLPGNLGPTIARAVTRLPQPARMRRRLAPYGVDEATLLTQMLTTALPSEILHATARGALARALQHYTPEDTVRELLRQAPPRTIGIVNAMRYLDLKLTLAGDMLVKIDRASMAVALEVRPVYLHRDVVALATHLPATRLANRSQSKAALKAAFRPWLPEALLYRQKMGFALPLPNWIGGRLRPLFARDREGIIDTLLDTSTIEALAPTAAVCHSQFFLRRWLAGWGSAEPAGRPSDELVSVQ